MDSSSHLLSCQLIVASGTTLTIGAGVTVFATPNISAAIIVQPGAQIIAQGTADAPYARKGSNPGLALL